MSAACPRCGQPLVGGYRFCRSCGLDLALVDPPVAGGASAVPYPDPFGPIAAIPPASVAAPANQLAAAGGVAWIIAAALTGYLALLQFGFVGTILDGGSLQALAIWNGFAAALTLYFGVRCLKEPPRGFLTTMVAWGVLNVVWGINQVSGGASHWAYLGSIVAAGVAGGLCLAARSGAPEGSRKRR